MENDLYDDSRLTYKQKLELIKWIPIRQQERYDRIKQLRDLTNITMEQKHFLMLQVLKLMVRQRERLIRLKKEVLT